MQKPLDGRRVFTEKLYLLAIINNREIVGASWVYHKLCLQKQSVLWV